jgi:hypothetical protein
MAAKSPAIAAGPVEREIVARLAAAKFRLRFDKVALRFVARVKAALAGAVPEGESVVFAITAPIRSPAKAALAVESLARACPPGSERRATIHDNEVRVCRLTGVRKRMPRALGFVHNVESDAGAVLDLAEALLTDPNRED